MRIEQRIFPNGLRLLVDEMPSACSCTVNLCVASGLRYEQPELTGVSHMIEHMLFKGTANRSARQLAEEADDRGANMNAYTCKEYTCIYTRSLPEHLEDMLELLADMIRNSLLDAKDLETEKGVVLEEIAMYEDMPEDLAFDLFYDMLWPDHLLGKNILGTRETVTAMQTEDLRRHLATFFAPERMVLSVCGKFDPAALESAVAERFGGIPAGGGAPLHAARLQPAAFHAGERFTAKPVEQNQMILAFPGCSGADPQRYQAALLSTMLGGATSSRLFQRLREELGLVYSVEYFNVHHCVEGISGVSLALSEKTQVQALEEVLRILRDFPASVTQQELRRAQEQAAAGLVMSLESGAARASRAAFHALLFGETTPVEESIRQYRAVTLDAIRAYAAQVLQPEAFAFCVLGKCSKKAEKALRQLLKQK
ncbi:MAG: insulinase family protein [Oscillospiraceae bacterium]|nr:insulinase family protein [Oscillospiraceae bacterium]